MSLTTTRIACRCGTTIETAFTSELESWQTRHDKCFQPAREWVGLSDEEMRELEKKFNAERVRTSDEEYLVIYPGDYWNWQRAIEAKLKEKNA